MQFCTCDAQFCEHMGTYNSYRILEPWTVLRYFNPDSNDPSLGATTSSYSNDANGPFSPNTTSCDHNIAISSGDARNMSLTPVPTPSSSASSISSAIQPDTTQILGYSSDGHFPQDLNHFANSPAYAGPPERGLTNESYQAYGSAMYAESPDDWSGSYGA